MRKYLLAGALLAFAGPALAQQATNVSGNECWNAGQGPGGPSTGALCLNMVRNGQAFTTFSGSGAQTTTATQNNATMMWTGTAPTTWAITLPNPAFDGEIIEISTDTTLTTNVTVTAGTTPQNQTLAAAYSSQTISAGASVEFRFSYPALKWWRLR
jgi:hypothetical protein